VWVIAHECGHHAFSDYQWLDDTVGLIFHSCLLVPYFSWKFSHAKHHHYTNHMTLDEPHMPSLITPEERAKVDKGEVPHPNNPSLLALYTRWTVPFVMLLFGWPLYLAINASGPPKKELVCPNRRHFGVTGVVGPATVELPIW
jgi:omega-6 fatty acid desaturase (delta-12 desaturase)